MNYVHGKWPTTGQTKDTNSFGMNSNLERYVELMDFSYQTSKDNMNSTSDTLQCVFHMFHLHDIFLLASGTFCDL